MNLLLALALVAHSNPGATAAAPHYKLVKEVKLGGDGGWDYLYADAESHRLYISRGTHVMVVDTRNDTLAGDIPDTPGVHGVALAHRHGVGFSSNGRDNTVSEFDLKTLKLVKKINVGQRPDAIFYDPFSDRVFTFNAGSQDTTAIDAGTGNVAGSIPLGGKPEFPASDGTGRMFVNIEDKSTIVQFDPVKLTVVNTWPIAPGESASGLAIDTKDHVLFATCDNQKMAVVDYNTGQVVGTPMIGDGPDAAGFDPGRKLAFSSNGQDGTITVLGQDSSGAWTPVQTVATKKSARTMTVDTRTHKIYLVCAQMAAPANGERRGRMIPGSFTLLVVAP
jgi:DNA-binding beta-propeller fold protein YncE